jgi:hypothetical protein
MNGRAAITRDVTQDIAAGGGVMPIDLGEFVLTQHDFLDVRPLNPNWPLARYFVLLGSLEAVFLAPLSAFSRKVPKLCTNS